MPLTRRKAIALIGGGSVLAASAAGGAWLATRTPHDARAPWGAAGGHGDARLDALSFAILAPSAHNLQPWLAELHGRDSLLIWRDTARDLPATDPYDRQLTISMGAFLETFDLAAGKAGHGVETRLFPDVATRPGLEPVAELRLADGGRHDPLADHILARRTIREPYEEALPPARALAALDRHAKLITEPADVAALRDLTLRAWEIEAKTEAIWRENVDLMRFGRAEIEARPDGIALGGPMLEAMMLVGILSPETQADPGSQAFRATLDLYRRMLPATPAYATITTRGNSRTDQIAAGRAWMRLSLAATGEGLALQPVSQCLQEFPEMEGPRAEAQAALAGSGETVQMLARLGHGPDAPPAPRWPLESRLLGDG